MIEPRTADHDRMPERPGTADAAWLDVEVVWSRDRPAVLVRGQLDVSTAPLLGSVLEHVHCSYPGRVVADLRQVSFIDSAGAAPLIEHGVHVQTASRTVLRLLRLLQPVDGAATGRPRTRQ